MTNTYVIAGCYRKQKFKIRIRKAKLGETEPETGTSTFIRSKALEAVINWHNYGKNVTFILFDGTYL